MKIACLSGKGGAGKTLVAVNLIAAAAEGTYIDCDVEEPNGRLFLKPEKTQTEIVSTLLPEFDAEKCTGCKQCVEFCRFHALMYIKGNCNDVEVEQFDMFIEAFNLLLGNASVIWGMEDSEESGDNKSILILLGYGKRE